MLTTAETEKGEKITLSGTCDVLLSMADVGNSLNKVKLGTETLRKAGATDQEKYDALHSAAQGLKESAKKINKLDSDSKKLLNDILIETLSGENVQKITLEYINFDSAAQFFESFADYVKKIKINPEAVSQEEVNKIVNGFAGSGFLVDMFIGDGMSPVATIYKVETEDYLKFANAINSNTYLSILQKAALLTVFGVSI